LKKVMFIIGSLKAGGSERVVTELANYMTGFYEVYILTTSKSEEFYETKKNIKIINLSEELDSENRKTNFIKMLLLYFFKLKKRIDIIRAVSPDTIISFVHTNNIKSILVGKTLKIQTVVSERGNPDYLAISKKRWVVFLQKLLYPKCDSLVVQTERVKKYFINMVKNIVIIPNPVRKFQLNSEIKKEKVVLSVGRLVPVKGYDIAINAFANLNIDGWKYIIAGEGQERKNLEIIIKEKKLEGKVELVGNIKEIEEIYQKASIFLFSSLREGFPNALLEAMSFGLPCISFDCDYGPREMIEDGVNGYLIKNGDTEEMSEKIKFLVENEEERIRIGKEAEKVKEKYSIEKIAKEWISIIERL
jgi:GalNAc-alpha-(1->4)-GalNAc-alpha-(1->3)-diNAcBac-PP-undecaprenol alpha-1,4-N-acetyl-D-galactosaminyltransferase